MILWFRRKQDAELDQELQSHLRMAAEDRVDRGVSLAQAEDAARRELGNLGLIKEVTREMWGWASLERLLHDLRFGVRILRKNPGFALVAILTLALGISSSTAMFSVVYGVLLRPLDYDKPQQIVEVFGLNEKGQRTQIADPNFEDLRAQNHSLQGMAEFSSDVESVAGGNEPKRLQVAEVSRDFFAVMGVRAIRGRLFIPEEQQVGAVRSAIVSHAYWKQFLNGELDLSSVKLRIGNDVTAVVGVLPPGFGFPTNVENSDIWLARETEAMLPSRSANNWQVVGRLRDAVPTAQALLDLRAIARRLKQEYGQETTMQDTAVVSLQEAMTGAVRPALLLLLGAVGLLLLVACANVTSLLLAQAAAREGELALRSALGASRGRLIRQFLAETLLLTLIGGALGVAAAHFEVRGLLLIAPADTPRLNEVSVNVPVLLFALGLCIAVAAVLGIFTALRATSGDVQSGLAESGRGQGNAPSSARGGRTIIAGQLAVTLLLLVGAGLEGRSLLRVLSIDPGFQTEHIVTIDMALPDAEGPSGRVQRTRFIALLLDRLRALPGVEHVGATDSFPLSTGFNSEGTFAILNPDQLSVKDRALVNEITGISPREAHHLDEVIAFFDKLFHGPAQTGNATYAAVSDDYFSVLRIPLLRGRLFDARDEADAPHVAIISDAVAKKQWPNQDPLGQTIEFGNIDTDLRLLTIIGVVGDIRGDNLEEPRQPTIYVNLRQRPQRANPFTVAVRTTADAGITLLAARKIVNELDPDIPPKSNTFTQVVAAALHNRRFNLILVSLFALTALLLAVAGIYGVLGYSVARRTREVGVRMALGATAGDVLRLILRQAVLTALAGIVIGLVASFALTHTMRSLLFETSTTDPMTFSCVAVLLMLVATAAAFIPARRATKVDPIVALRHD